MNCPAQIREGGGRAEVAFAVSAYLVFPEGSVRAGKFGFAAGVVAMPKAAMDK